MHSGHKQATAGVAWKMATPSTASCLYAQIALEASKTVHRE